MLPANHRWQSIPLKTPEAQVAAELSLRTCTLREQNPGTRAYVSCQKDVHIKRQPRPHRMDGGTLADANKAETSAN